MFTLGILWQGEASQRSTVEIKGESTSTLASTQLYCNCWIISWSLAPVIRAQTILSSPTFVLQPLGVPCHYICSETIKQTVPVSIFCIHQACHATEKKKLQYLLNRKVLCHSKRGAPLQVTASRSLVLFCFRPHLLHCVLTLPSIRMLCVVPNTMFWCWLARLGLRV